MFSLASHLRRGHLLHTAILLAVLVGMFAAGFYQLTPDNSGVTSAANLPPAASSSFAAAPANDNYANAQTIAGATGKVSGSNVGATKESNEPNHAGVAGVGSIWFQWQAPETGSFVFTTVGSFADTLLAVYTGDTMATATLVPGAANDEENGPLCSFSFPVQFSGVTLNAIGGTVYHIAIDTKFSSSGNITLRWGRRAQISGRITDTSLRSSPVDSVELQIGGVCYKKADGIFFTNIPTGQNYFVFPISRTSPFIALMPNSPSISPLTGDVGNLDFYKASPTKNITGKVIIPGPDTSGISVTCVSTPGGLISYPANDLGAGSYQCNGLPVGGDYIVTAAKLGYTFTCDTINPNCHTTFFRFNNLGDNWFQVDFNGTVAPTHIISGLITQPNGTTGVSGVTVTLSGSQTGSKVTDANGNYSFTGLLHGGNYTVTPSGTNVMFTPPSVTLSNLSSDSSASFFAASVPQLILDDVGQVAAVDSMLLLRDPFPVINSANVLNRGADRNTRVTIFLANVQLGPTEPSSTVVITLVDSNNQTYDIPAEDVRAVAGVGGFTQVIFRLPNTLAPGACTLVVKSHGLTSATGTIRISN